MALLYREPAFGGKTSLDLSRILVILLFHSKPYLTTHPFCTQARQQQQPKLARAPKHAPTTKPWHAVRDGVVQRVAEILGGDGGPTVAALSGRSGAGKTSAAAAMVGERGPVRPRTGESEDVTRTRLDRVRALFPDGVVWLRVGRGGGAADRIPSLMHNFAMEVWEGVMQKRVNPPAVGGSGESYVRKIMLQESLRYLVVADDVWEAGVLEKVRKTGMWVLLTTRQPSLVRHNETVVVDQLAQEEAEEVLRGATGLRVVNTCVTARWRC